MKEKADENDKVVDDNIKAVTTKLEKASFIKRLAPYNKPFINVAIGILTSII